MDSWDLKWIMIMYFNQAIHSQIMITRNYISSQNYLLKYVYIFCQPPPPPQAGADGHTKPCFI